jgi:hypothetical protein
LAEAAVWVEVGSWPPAEASHGEVPTSALSSTQKPQADTGWWQEWEEVKSLTPPPPERNER